jgi:hypothetical protein
MLDKYEVPRELMGSFKRIARRVPVELKKDEELIQTLIAYLELGGEKLARQAVEAAKQTLALEATERRKKAREEALIRAAEARLAAKDAESDDDDDDFDEDDDEDEDDEDEDLKDY